MGVSIWLVIGTYTEWRERPVMVSLEDKMRNICSLPFPAITICSEMRNISEGEHIQNLLCKKMNKNSEISNITKTNDEIMQDIERTNLKLVPRIEFGAEIGDLRSEEGFEELMTDEGLCYTFNMVHANDLFPNNTFFHHKYLLHERNNNYCEWSLEDGYDKTCKSTTYPMRAYSSGVSAGVAIKISIPRVMYMGTTCQEAAPGFKVQLHHPGQFPQVGMQPIKVARNSETLISVSPEMMTAARDVLHYSKESRNCYLPGEHPLQFFKMYTLQNCELECMANFTKNKCGCVAHYMPRHQLWEETNDTLNSRQTMCDCRRACTSLSYYSERSQISFNSEMGKNDTVKLIVFFKESLFIASQRVEFYSIPKLLAACGGSLSLGTGISILSLVELLYWMTIRPLIRKTSNKTHNKKPSSDIEMQE